MAEEHDLSIIKGLEGCISDYSLSEFTEYLNADLSSKKLEYGWVFWRPETYQQSEYETSYHDSDSTSYETEIKQKILSVLEARASEREGWLWCDSLVQFWAAKVEGRHHYLSTSDQPFCIRDLSKGFCWYRKQCIDHYIVLEEGATQEQLGAIGRVYRNKHPESSPDLRLYSTNEFPLRDHAARCGLTRYLALPVFDLLKNECYGVLEVLSFCNTPATELFISIDRGIQVGRLRSTHTNFFPITDLRTESMPPKYKQQPESEISRMLELAIKVIPQLHLAQVWVACKQCANMSGNLSCLERATFIIDQFESVNTCKLIDLDTFDYLQACEFHNLQIGKGIARAIMSSHSKSYICRNLCDISISENPLAHYAQKARLSLYFVVSLESVHNSNDLYVVEFFLKSDCRKGPCGDSVIHLLLRVMEMELKSYKFALGGQLEEELLVELGQPNVVQYECSEYEQEMKHQHSEELKMFMLMERYWESYSELNFQTYLQTVDLCCIQATALQGR